MSRSVTVILYGKKSVISVEESESILEAAIRQNLDPPYACQIGSCCTCRAKKLSGDVVMDDREALTDEEIARHLTNAQHYIDNARLYRDSLKPL